MNELDVFDFEDRPVYWARIYSAYKNLYSWKKSANASELNITRRIPEAGNLKPTC